MASAAWTRKEGKSKSGGLNAKGRASYKKENPGPVGGARKAAAKGGRMGYKHGKSVKKKGGCAIKGKSPILR